MKNVAVGVARNTPIVVSSVQQLYDSYEVAKLLVQSEETMETLPLSEDSAPQTETEQTTTFVDNSGGMQVTAQAPSNSVAKVDGTEDLSLGTFLSRPVKINSFSWGPSDTGVIVAVSPWQLYFSNTAVKRKIENFAFFRGKLHIKTLINGSPFQYGLLRATYTPLRSTTSWRIRSNAVTPITDLIPLSQLPGFYIQPQANAGGSLEAPFFYNKNWLDLTSNSDVQGFGRLEYDVFYPIASATAGGSTTASVVTYAWLSDVELMGPTESLTLQADEYVEGPVSSPATAIASVASTLSHVPVIGRFARATEIGAKSVANIARLFGYTNVPVIDDVRGFQPMNGPMLASAHIGVPAQKLTYDPKQELSIDPSIHGLKPVDELALSYLKKKESYFAASSWSTNDALGSVLFNMRINPYQFAAIPLLNGSSVEQARRVYHTPLSYMSEMFRSWRGGLKIRVKVVCTKFHKGRLKVSFDPRANISTHAVDENLVYTEIIDIGETDEVEFIIPYHQATAWLDIDKDITDTNWAPGTNLPPRLGIDNGSLNITVLNTLVAPATGSVGLMFFISGADDFEFANPSDHIGNDIATTTYKEPSFLAVQADDHVELSPKAITLGIPVSPSKDRYAQNYGEVITSLRTVLHRSSISDYTYLAPFAANSIRLIGKAYRVLPNTPGYTSGTFLSSANKVLTAGTAAYNFSYMHPMLWISSLFGGFRGSATITVTPSADLRNGISNVQVSRSDTVQGNNTQLSNVTLTNPGTVSQQLALLSNPGVVLPGSGGLALTSTNTNGSLSFNLPFFSKYNFGYTFPTQAGSNQDDTDKMCAMLTMFHTTGADASTSAMAFSNAWCAGPDFTCLFFLNCPTVDYLKNPAVAV